MKLCRIAVVALGCAAGCEVAGQAPARSPFMPPKSSGPAAPTQGAPLEFRAYLNNGSDTLYRIYDPAKKAGVWVKLNEKNPDFDLVVKQHDEGQKTLTIEHGGRTLTLAEREPKVVSGGSVAQAAPPPPPAPIQPANVAPAVTQSVVLNPTPADEQRRLEAVAAEVARRRALREQATQQINQQGPQPANAPQTVPGMPGQQPGNVRR